MILTWAPAMGSITRASLRADGPDHRSAGARRAREKITKCRFFAPTFGASPDNRVETRPCTPS